MATMRAPVLRVPGEIHFEERPVPQPGPGEVVIAVKACGICGSDLHAFEGYGGLITYPRVLGHEFSGAVAAMGADVADWKTGDRVCCDINLPCGVCASCREGAAQRCTEGKLIGISEDGAFAPYVLNRAENLHRLPGNLSFAQGAATQPVGVGYHAVAERARVQAGEAVAVIGAGPVGLGAAGVAKAAGARVFIADTVPYRLEAALKMGMDAVAAAGKGDPASALLDFTGGEGADYVVDCTGGMQEKTPELWPKMVRRGGAIVNVGVFGLAPAIPMTALQVREADILNSWGQYRAFTPCLELVSSGKINVDPMITGTVSPDDLEAQLRRMQGEDKDFIKVIVAHP